MSVDSCEKHKNIYLNLAHNIQYCPAFWLLHDNLNQSWSKIGSSNLPSPTSFFRFPKLGFGKKVLTDKLFPPAATTPSQYLPYVAETRLRRRATTRLNWRWGLQAETRLRRRATTRLNWCWGLLPKPAYNAVPLLVWERWSLHGPAYLPRQASTPPPSPPGWPDNFFRRDQLLTSVSRSIPWLQRQPMPQLLVTGDPATTLIGVKPLLLEKLKFCGDFFCRRFLKNHPTDPAQIWGLALMELHLWPTRWKNLSPPEGPLYEW